MAPRTNINIAIGRLIKESLHVSKWAEKYGSDMQKDMMRQYVTVTVKVIQKLSPEYAGYQIPVWELPSAEYLPERKPDPIPADPPPSWTKLEGELIAPYSYGRKARAEDKPIDTDTPLEPGSPKHDAWRLGWLECNEYLKWVARNSATDPNPEGN